MFFDRYKCEDLIKYREEFLDEIKKLLFYLIEFFEDRSMISKEYSKNCTLGRLNKQLVIMITYNESTFSANNG